MGKLGNVRTGTMHLCLDINGCRAFALMAGPSSSCFLCCPGSLGLTVEAEEGTGQWSISFKD